jgi:hypothetical protein
MSSFFAVLIKFSCVGVRQTLSCSAFVAERISRVLGEEMSIHESTESESLQKSFNEVPDCESSEYCSECGRGNIYCDCLLNTCSDDEIDDSIIIPQVRVTKKDRFNAFLACNGYERRTRRDFYGIARIGKHPAKLPRYKDHGQKRASRVVRDDYFAYCDSQSIEKRE